MNAFMRLAENLRIILHSRRPILCDTETLNAEFDIIIMESQCFSGFLVSISWFVCIKWFCVKTYMRIFGACFVPFFAFIPHLYA